MPRSEDVERRAGPTAEADAIDVTALRAAVDKLRWFHTIDLGHGVVTPGATDPARKVLPTLGLPQDLTGVSVLDVGAWDGFYSFEAERRGARRVVATDSYCWLGPGWGTKEAFLLARDALRSSVEDVDIDVMDLAPERVGTFDLVLFLGVLYHLRDPVGAMQRVASVTTNQLIMETEARLDWLPWPSARVFVDRELNNDPTNLFAFNTSALMGLLRKAGFARCSIHYRSPWPRRLARVTYSLWRGWPPSRLANRRVVLHAWRDHAELPISRTSL